MVHRSVRGCETIAVDSVYHITVNHIVHDPLRDLEWKRQNIQEHTQKAQMVNENGTSTNHSESKKESRGKSNFVDAHSWSSLSSSSSKDETIEAGPVSPTHSPCVQVMDRSGGYDPNRIPSSVFERIKSDKPVEWSCASNESLFSIHLGNNSFSVYNDPTKSGELSKSGELLALCPSSHVTPLTVECKEKIDDLEKERAEAEAKVENDKEVISGQPVVPWKSPNASYSPIRNRNSMQSFTFPILADGVTSEPATPEADDCSEEKHIQPAGEAHPNPSSNSCFSCLPSCPWCRSCSRS